MVAGASHKGLMNPPGLAFVSVSERAWKAAQSSGLPKYYLDWKAMRAKLPGHQTPFTPAVSLVAGMEEALRLIREEGIDKVWRRTAELASYTRSEVDGMGLELFAKAPADVVTAIMLPKGVDGKRLVREIREKDRIQVAGGQLRLEGRIVRVAHMGYIRKADVAAGLKALAKRLKAS